MPIFLHLMARDPESLQGRISAFVAAIDTTEDAKLQLHYYNALLAEAAHQPNSIPVHWMVGIVTRTITGEHARWPISGARRLRILQTGERSYSRVRSLLGAQEGPFCVHQTWANLLNELEAYDQAAIHREIALKWDRYPVSLHGAAWTLLSGGRCEEALSCINEALSMGASQEKFHRVKGDILWALDRLPEAIKSWHRAALASTENKSFYWDHCSRACLRLGKLSDAKVYSGLALAERADVSSYQISDARLAAMVGEPDGPERVKKADVFDFNGNVVRQERDESKDKKNSPLLEAAATGDLEALRRAMASCDLDVLSGKHKQTALMVAAQNGFTHILDEFLRAGASLDVVDANGDTALHYASQFNQQATVRRLVGAGAKTNLQDKWKQTPLIMAASNRDIGCFRELVHKSPLEMATPHGGTALHYASGYGLMTLLQELIAAGADVNSTARRGGQTPLMAACDEWPHPYIVAPLVRAGAEINRRDVDGKTALHHAVNPLMSLALVEVLLEHGADPTLADKHGVTCIRAARSLGFEDVALKMEAKAGVSEPFVFPKLEVPLLGSKVEEQRAAFFELPLLLAQRHLLGGMKVRENKSNAARSELRRIFGIENAENLAANLSELKAFKSPEDNASGSLSEEMSVEGVRALANRAAEKTFRFGFPGVLDGSAWNHAHLIYLSRLGVAAGYLSPQKAEATVKSSTELIASNFSGWKDFLGSFLFGASRLDGWERQRYENIANLLLSLGPEWPAL